MAHFTFAVPSLGSMFVDYRDSVLGDSYSWSWERALSEVRYIVIHHTAGPNNQTVDDIASYHVNTLGWGGIGYHFVISRDGTTYYVGDLSTARANVSNMNESVIGICLIGTFMNNQNPTEAQIHATHELSAQMLFRTPELTNINGWEDVVPHSQLTATACPGNTFETWRVQILEGVAPEVPQDNTARIQDITKLYQVVLGREPDQSGLNTYASGPLSIEQIRKAMTESSEHRQIIDRARSLKQASTIALESLSSLTQTYQKIEQISKIGQ